MVVSIFMSVGFQVSCSPLGPLFTTGACPLPCPRGAKAERHCSRLPVSTRPFPYPFLNLAKLTLNNPLCGRFNCGHVQKSLHQENSNKSNLLLPYPPGSCGYLNLLNSIKFKILFVICTRHTSTRSTGTGA